MLKEEAKNIIKGAIAGSSVFSEDFLVPSAIFLRSYKD